MGEIVLAQNRQLKILMVSAEVVPFAKTGGLADVAGSLPQSLSALGHDVRIAMPRYKQINETMKYVTDFPVNMDWRKETCVVRESHINFQLNSEKKEVPVYFVDSYHYYDRDGMYCHMDDGERFAFLCKAVLKMLPKIGFQPDIIHCNDWHAGPITYLLKKIKEEDAFYKDIETIFTIHNLQYQGNYSKDLLKVFGIGEEHFTPDELEFYGQFSFIKTGIMYSTKINAVSETYAEEIKTPEYGEYLDGLLRNRAEDLYGIVNGISDEHFNPKTDKTLVKNYDANDIEAKKENKVFLQKRINLPVKDVPIFGIVSRLVDQKGLDLIADIFDKMMEHDVQFVLLGLGSPHYEDMFRKFAEKYPDKVASFNEFNEPLAQQIYAGSDIFFMPSRFEPCGLGQLISLKYGTIPIVRQTGGLADTICDYNLETGEGNGFMFKEYQSEKLLDAVERCINVYKNYPDKWKELVKNALLSDFSWDKQAGKYIELYNIALAK